MIVLSGIEGAKNTFDHGVASHDPIRRNVFDRITKECLEVASDQNNINGIMSRKRPHPDEFNSDEDDSGIFSDQTSREIVAEEEDPEASMSLICWSFEMICMSSALQQTLRGLKTLKI